MNNIYIWYKNLELALQIVDTLGSHVTIPFYCLPENKAKRKD